jgi:hypothetical protein
MVSPMEHHSQVPAEQSEFVGTVRRGPVPIIKITITKPSQMTLDPLLVSNGGARQWHYNNHKHNNVDLGRHLAYLREHISKGFANILQYAM